MAENIPNLDAMSPDDLMEFWLKHQHGRKRKELFPEGGKGSMVMTRDLANYACNKAVAIRCRLSGDIQAAINYEMICDGIYRRLPERPRW